MSTARKQEGCTRRGGDGEGTAEAKSQWQEQVRPGKTSQNASRRVGVLVIPISQRGKLRLSKVEPPAGQWQIAGSSPSLSEVTVTLGGGWVGPWREDRQAGQARQARWWCVKRKRDLLKDGWITEAGGEEWGRGDDGPSDRGGAWPLGTKDHIPSGPPWWAEGGPAWCPSPTQRTGLWDSGGRIPPSLTEGG